MKRRTKNSIMLLIILLLFTLIGAIYAFSFQGREISQKEKKLIELRMDFKNTETLLAQLEETSRRSAYTDSVLGEYSKNIPCAVPEERFFDFVNRHSQEFFVYTGASVELKETINSKDVSRHSYKVYGTGRFIDVYNLVYAIENSRELKKIESAEIKANTVVNSEGRPKYLVSFNLMVNVYFTANNFLASSIIKENDLSPKYIANAYYPLIRNEIPPNTENLPDIQNASLISLVPQGAFIHINDGNTFLMEKGDPVYLGYLTDIDYAAGRAIFTLNKGGLVEEVILELGSKNKKGK